MQIIYLDISNKGVVPTIYAKQGDVGRKVQVIFMDSGIPYEIPENAGLSVWYDGDSGDGNYTDIGNKSAIVVENNKVTFELITQMLNNDGEGIVCLIMNVGEEQIGSWNIRYLCEKVPGFESEGAKEYYTAFSKSVEGLKQVTENLTPEAIGAHPDTWLPTIEEIGAAPAGYGLGGTCTEIDSLDNALNDGFYVSGAGGPVAGSYFQGIVINYGNSVIVQKVWKTWDDALYKAERRQYNGVWEPWEWVNPPMIPGNEYRTTERHNGKPVWKCLTKITGLPNSAYGMYNLVATYCERMVGKHISYERTDGADFLELVEAGKVYLGNYGTPYIVFDMTQADLSTTTAYVTLLYTKTTD